MPSSTLNVNELGVPKLYAIRHKVTGKFVYQNSPQWSAKKFKIFESKGSAESFIVGMQNSLDHWRVIVANKDLPNPKYDNPNYAHNKIVYDGWAQDWLKQEKSYEDFLLNAELVELNGCYWSRMERD